MKYELPQTVEWINKYKRYQTLFFTTNKAESEILEMNNLKQQLSPYILSANDVNITSTLLSDKTDKTYVDSELGKKQNSLGYTPVNKSGDTMTGQLGVESTTFPVIDIARNTSSTGGNLYGGARLQRKTTNPTNGVGIGFYFQAPNSNKTMTHAGMFGGALGTIQAGSEKGEIVFGPSYAGQDPYTRRDLVIRAISASKAEAELNGKLTADNTVYSDAPNTVTTKKYVDDGLDSKVDNSRVLTDVPINAKFTDTITTVNGKTGAITKTDITALGIPAQDTVVDISGKADKTYVDSKVKTDVPEDAKFTDTLSPNLTLTRLTLGNYEIVYNEMEESLDFEVVE